MTMFYNKIAIHSLTLTYRQTFSFWDYLKYLGLIEFFVVFSFQVVETLRLSIIVRSRPLQK